jgi:hypothetical protein
MAMCVRKYGIARWTLCLSISLLLVLGIATTGQVIDEENTATTCDAMDGTCNNEAKADATLYRRDLPASYCGEITTTKDLYRYGGTAQAYKPGTVVSPNVCSETLSNESLYKVASWPFTRRTSKTSPIMNFSLKLYGCSNEDSNHSSSCDCSPLVTTKSVVEIWQTRPDGLYGSPRNIKNNDDNNDDECRATIPVDTRTGRAHFTTVAPGSTGIMGGLGPRSSDYWPYGPPVIHILVTTPPTSNENHNDVLLLYAPLLLDLPALIHPTTLEQRSFSLSALDWRGNAWSKRKQSKGTVPPFDTTSWIVNDEKNRIDIDVDIFLERIQPPVADITTASAADPEFCPSFTHILPGAFFLEPIAVCAKSLLDFFPM